MGVRGIGPARMCVQCGQWGALTGPGGRVGSQAVLGGMVVRVSVAARRGDEGCWDEGGVGSWGWLEGGRSGGHEDGVEGLAEGHGGEGAVGG